MCLVSVVIFNVLFVCVILLPRIFGQANADKCHTPRNEVGQCVLLAKCPTIAEILRRRPVSPADAEYLRKSGCGFEGLEPKVCCPDTSAASTTHHTVIPPTESYQEFDDLLPSLEECGAEQESKIVGGEYAELNEFPWMALVEYQTRNGKGYHCGGVLINSRYVLTAAHCIKGKDLPTTWRLTGVRLGEHNTTSEKDCVRVPGGVQCSLDPVDVPVEAQIAHEDYDPYDANQYHDIGLLRLAEPVKNADNVKPICLPRGDMLQETFAGEQTYVAGWGKTENRSVSDVILKLRIQVKENSACQSTYRSVRVKIDDVQLCAGGLKGQDSCRGDSGGPLMKAITTNGNYNYYALGVVSFGPSPCGMEGWPGVYTRVTKYVPWIISKLKP